MAKETRVLEVTDFFAALADRTRLRIINLIGDDEICVCYLVEVIGTNQPKISRHLAYLRKLGIVEARQEGKWVHYRLREPDDENAARVLSNVRGWLKSDVEMQSDLQKLTSVCCAPLASQPVTIQSAPRPMSFSVFKQS